MVQKMLNDLCEDVMDKTNNANRVNQVFIKNNLFSYLVLKEWCLTHNTTREYLD